MRLLYVQAGPPLVYIDKIGIFFGFTAAQPDANIGSA